MSKRFVAALLWFGAIWFGYEILWSMMDVPRALGPIVAAAVSTFVTVDPGRLIWHSTPERRTAALAHPG